jgi:hypothetical protein
VPPFLVIAAATSAPSFFATAGKDDFGARFGKGQRRGFADTGGASGDEHYFVSIGVLHNRQELIG